MLLLLVVLLLLLVLLVLVLLLLLLVVVVVVVLLLLLTRPYAWGITLALAAAVTIVVTAAAAANVAACMQPTLNVCSAGASVTCAQSIFNLAARIAAAFLRSWCTFCWTGFSIATSDVGADEAAGEAPE